jgi:hypothetical protein
MVRSLSETFCSVLRHGLAAAPINQSDEEITRGVCTNLACTANLHAHTWCARHDCRERAKAHRGGAVPYHAQLCVHDRAHQALHCLRSRIQTCQGAVPRLFAGASWV